MGKTEREMRYVRYTPRKQKTTYPTSVSTPEKKQKY